MINPLVHLWIDVAYTLMEKRISRLWDGMVSFMIKIFCTLNTLRLPLLYVSRNAMSLICQDIFVQEEFEKIVTIGQGTVIHPRCTIQKESPECGSIVIGENCIIEEGCIIINK